MLKQKLILSYSSQIGYQLLQVVASIVVARIAGPTVLGTVAFGTAYVSVMLFIADLGIATAHIKFLSEGKEEGKCIGTYAVLKTATTLLFVMVVLSFYLVQKHVFDKEFESKVHEYVIFISLTAISINQFLFISRTTFAARTEQAKIAIIDLSRGIFLQPARIIIVLLGFGAIALAFSNLASFLILIPIYIYFFRGYPIGKFDWQLAKQYLRVSFPVIFIAMSTNVVSQIDKVLLQFFTSSEEVGYYTAGYKIGGFVLLIGKSVRNLFFPLFSKAVAEKNDGYIKDKLSRYERFGFQFIMPFIILVFVFSKSIVLLILGEEYLSSVFVMRFITAAMFIMILNMPYNSVIDGLGKFKLSAIINVINLVLFVGTLYILASPEVLGMGSNGAALTVLISNIFMGITFRVYSRKFFPGLTQTKPVKFIIAGIAITAISYYSYQALWTDPSYLIQVAFAIVILIVTYLTFFIFGWMKVSDLKDLMALVDVKSMFRYVKNEVGNRKKVK